MNLGIIFTLAAILLISASAAALVDLPEQTTIEVPILANSANNQEGVEISFFVSNTKNVRSPLEINAIFPTPFEIQKPEWVDAKSSEQVTIKIFGKNGFENTTYTGSIFIDLGGEREEKRVTINYVGKSPQEEQAPDMGSPLLSGFATLLQGGEDSQAALDIFLMIIAAILLVAFIARLVKASTERD